jgi:hypothetical protein
LPPLPSEWLNRIGIVQFTQPAIDSIWSYAQAWAGTRAVYSTEAEQSFRAFIELGAIEFALVPLYRGDLSAGEKGLLADISPVGRIFPVTVPDSAAADAIFKTDCGPFSEHRPKEQSGLRLWDVFTFAGDMSKFELLGFADKANALADHKVMQTQVDALAERYNAAGLSNRVVESGLLAVQGLVWFAKLALLRGEDYTDTRDLHFVARYLPEIA